MSGSAEASRGAFSPAAVVSLILVGVFAFAAVLVLSAYAPELRRSGGSGANALSRSAVGYAGAVVLLKSRGVDVDTSRDVYASTSGVLVLTPRPEQSPEVVADPREASVLIVLPKWGTQPDRKVRGWVRKGEPIPTSELEALLEELAPGTKVERVSGRARPRLEVREVRAGVRTSPADEAAETPAPQPGPAQGRLLFPPGARLEPGPVDALQTVVGASWTPVVGVAGGDSNAVLVKHGARNIYVLSEPDLLNTHGLADVGTARAGLAIMDALRGPDGEVLFDLTLHGLGRSQGLLRLALGPPFLGATLCLVAAAVLMGLHAAARFGPARSPQRAFALGKTALADNTAALIRLTRREPRMARGYAELVRSAAARAVGAPRDLSPDQLDQFLDRLSRRRGASSDYTTLAGETPSVHGREGLVRFARALQHWKKEITGEHH